MRDKPLGPWFGVERAAEYLGIGVDTLKSSAAMAAARFISSVDGASAIAIHG